MILVIKGRCISALDFSISAGMSTTGLIALKLLAVALNL